MIPSPIRVVRETKLAAPPYGLPGPLPDGETIVWQGSPSWRHVARRSLHVRKIAFYFGLLEVLAVAHAVQAGAVAWFSVAALAVLTPVALGLLALFAYGIARTTVYTITTRRIVLRIGIALTASINLPFKFIESASVRLFADGTGDIPIVLEGRTRIGIVQLWPHARPWKLRSVQPMLRALPEAQTVARLLSQALAASADQAVPEPATVPAGPAPRRAGAGRFGPTLEATGA